jgi:hypothetical protein
MQENTTLNHDIEQSSVRELSLDEAEAVGGGSIWGTIVHDAKTVGTFTGLAAGAAYGAKLGEDAYKLTKSVGKGVGKSVSKLAGDLGKGVGDVKESPDIPPFEIIP